jgi:hypothetical protein
MYLFFRIPVFNRQYETISPMPELFTTPLERAGKQPLTLARL